MDFFHSKDFEDRVNHILNDWHCPGLAIGVVQDEKISTRGFGKACLDPEKPVTADTLFDIASSSKSLTAAAVSLLVEDENFPEVRWTAKMSSLLPDDFVMAEESYTKDVTLEDILSHRTGLPRHDFSYLHTDTPRTVTRNLRNLPLTQPIRSTQQYNNRLYTVATHLIETLTAQPLATYLRTRLLDLLHMSSTHLQPAAVRAAGLGDRLITPYRWDARTSTFHAAKLQQIPSAQGAGSIFTSANDYALWIRALLTRSGPITDAVYAGITKPRSIGDPEADPAELEPWSSHSMYAAGLDLVYYRGYQLFGHSGGDPGVGSYHFFLPRLGFGGVLLGNGDDAGTPAYVLARELVDAAIGVPDGERAQWNRRAREEEEKEDGEEEERWREMLSVSADDEAKATPLERGLEAYAGRYWNAGYHSMVVEVKNDQLFVDATDRTMGFTLTLEHLQEGEKFLGRVVDYCDEAERTLAIKFRVEGKEVVGMGVDLEDQMDDFIWFDRVGRPTETRIKE